MSNSCPRCGRDKRLNERHDPACSYVYHKKHVHVMKDGKCSCGFKGLGVR